MLSISNGLPIQFYLDGQQTYNEALADQDLIDFYCFEQEFNCNDAIRLKINETDPDIDYDLVFFDEEENIIHSEQFTKFRTFTTESPLEFLNGEFTTDLNNWSQDSVSGNKSFVWFTGTAASTSTTMGNSKQFGQSRSVIPGIGGYSKWPSGKYKFKVNLSNNPIGPDGFIKTFKIFGTDNFGGSKEETSGQVVAVAPNQTFEIEFTTTQEWGIIGFQFTGSGKIAVSASYIRIEENPKDYTTTVHSVDFTANELDLCDQSIKFKIQIRSTEYDSETEYNIGDVVSLNGIYYKSLIDENNDNLPPDSFPQWEVFNPVSGESDYVKFSSLTPKSVLIAYKSIKPYDGIYYDDTSDYLYLRIQGRFFHEDTPTTSKQMPLSRGRMVNTSSEIKHGTLLEIQDVPYYMHTKITSALSHSISGTILIAGYIWGFDPFEYQKDTERPLTYPNRSATCLLMRKDYITRNVI